MRLKSHLAGIPAYVAGRASPGSIKLSSNENPLGPSRRVFGRIKGTLEKIHLYPDPGCTQLRSLMAARMGVEPGQILLGNGSDEILMLIAAAYIGEGHNIVTADFTFPQYQFAARLFGAETRRCPLEDGRIRVERLASLVDGRTRAVYLCNPNNPTGTYSTQAEVEWLLASLPRDVLVVLDEAYCEYADAPDYPVSVALLKDHPNLLVLRTFSKAYGLAGLRIGYALAHPSLVADLHLPKFPFNVNRLAQAAAMAALEDEDHLTLVKLANLEGKAYLYRHLERLGVAHHKSQGNFVFAVLGEGHAGAAAALDEAGVSVRPFKLADGNHAVRVTVGTSLGNRTFIECLEAYLAAHRRAAEAEARAAEAAAAESRCARSSEAAPAEALAAIEAAPAAETGTLAAAAA